MLARKERELLWTTLSIEVITSWGTKKDIDKDIESAFLLAHDFEARYSRFIKNNEIFKLNNNLKKWNVISDELYQLLKIWKKFEKESGSTFSLTVKSILDSWWYNENYELWKQFPMWEIWEFLISDCWKKAYLNSPLEIWAIWKWFVVDKMHSIFKKYDYIFINAWWDIYARWVNQKWERAKAYLEHPLDLSIIIWEIVLNGNFLAWSSSAKRRWGNKHHLINVKEAKPADKMLATFVQWDNWVLSDWYSTVLFTMWYENAKKLIRSKNLAALIISENWDIYKSSNFWWIIYW